MNDKGDDENARKEIEHNNADGQENQGTPPAGPHAKERLVDREKTPGSGALPDDQGRDADVGPD